MMSRYPLRPALSKILVAVAGPAMNVVFAFAIATFDLFRRPAGAVNPPIIGYVDPQSPEGKLGIHEGDRIVAIDGKPVKSWEEIITHDDSGADQCFPSHHRARPVLPMFIR
jgi:regulator of sigma E protease